MIRYVLVNTKGEMDIKGLKKRWNHLYSISQWGDKYTLYKQKRKNSMSLAIKIILTPNQAREIIAELNLIQIRSTTYKVGSTWRTNETRRN